MRVAFFPTFFAHFQWVYVDFLCQQKNEEMERHSTETVGYTTQYTYKELHIIVNFYILVFLIILLCDEKAISFIFYPFSYDQRDVNSTKSRNVALFSICEKWQINDKNFHPLCPFMFLVSIFESDWNFRFPA